MSPSISISRLATSQPSSVGWNCAGYRIKEMYVFDSNVVIRSARTVHGPITMLGLPFRTSLSTNFSISVVGICWGPGVLLTLIGSSLVKPLSIDY